MSKSFLMELYKKASKNMSDKNILKVNLLYNKVVLYIVFIVSLINLLIWVVAGDVVNVLVFLLVGFLTTFFSKNMIVVLLLALVVSSIIKYGTEIGEEGFDNKEGLEEDYEGKAEGLEEDYEGKAEGLEEDYEGNAEGLEEDYEGNAEGLNTKENIESQSNTMDSENTSGSKSNTKDSENTSGSKSKTKDSQNNQEGMQTLGYAFVDANYSFSHMIQQQNKLLSNISALSPYLVMADNESKLRSQIKYSEFTKQ